MQITRRIYALVPISYCKLDRLVLQSTLSNTPGATLFTSPRTEPDCIVATFQSNPDPEFIFPSPIFNLISLAL
ncbi:hypothetical protein PISMIDRAFT_680192 [Pisolithus microcarpus 441]|uniref:Uncharacterized protein n=1 Tax=Pisolithus microcarpus 441 TaxID=765257 RepID=A0A0C9Z0L5_9AGAM|nr:hypothetical protein PISMIDRAFT_680192 [Pisolithus microcarpus 441]